MHRIARLARLARPAAERPATSRRRFQQHAHRVSPLRPSPDARPLTGLRKARRGDRDGLSALRSVV